MHEYTQLRMVSAYSKGSEMQFGHERPYHWKEDAACAFQPYSLFELASFDSPISDGISLEVDPSEENPKELDKMQAIRDLNADNFKKAQEICNSCPVWHECYQDAQEDDFEWTVRAGILPTKYNPTRQGRPRKADKYDEHGVPLCKKCGTPKEGIRSDRGRFCKPCKSQQTMEAARLKRAASSKPRPTTELFELGKKCGSGHDEWALRSKKKPDGPFYCMPCKRKNDRDYYARIKS